MEILYWLKNGQYDIAWGDGQCLFTAAITSLFLHMVSMDTTLIHTHTHIVNVVSGTKVHALHLASEAATPCPQQLAAMCQERGSAGKINLDGPTISCLPRRPYHQLCTPAGLSLNSITHRNTHTKHTLVALPAWPCPKPWITALMPA